MGVPMRVVVWGYMGGMGTLRIPYKLSTYGKFRYRRFGGVWGIGVTKFSYINRPN